MTDFIIHLRAEPSGVPVIVRLRGALKVLLRSFRLRVVSVAEVPHDAQPRIDDGTYHDTSNESTREIRSQSESGQNESTLSPWAG
ncbi:MAG: hypothetical protein ACREJC_14580 [Tepidisphaeraceae bacterium]